MISHSLDGYLDGLQFGVGVSRGGKAILHAMNRLIEGRRDDVGLSMLLKKTVKAVARFFDRMNRALGTGLIGKRVGNVLQQKTEAVRCFGTSISVGETGSTVPDDGGDRWVLEKQYGVNIMALAVQIEMALDVAGEEVVGPGGAEMVVNVSNGMPWLKKTVKAVARFLDRVNRALGTGLIGKRVGNVLQQKTEAVRCFGTSIIVGETRSTVPNDGGDRMALDVAVEEVVGPGGAEMVVNVSNGMPWLKKTVKAVARFLDRVNRALGTGLVGKRVGNVLQQKTEAVRCFGTSIVVGETESTVLDNGGDRRVLEKQHGVNIMALAVQIGMALDVAGEEVVGPGGAEMVVNVSNGMPW
nr:hypothetical protein [Tanacetum cinerariifolium]